MAAEIMRMPISPRQTSFEEISPGSRRRQVEALGTNPALIDPTELDLLRSWATSDPDQFVREYATKALMRAAEAGVLDATQALSSVLVGTSGPNAIDAKNRVRAARALCEHAESLGEVELGALRDATVSDMNPVVREHCLRALGQAAVAGHAGLMSTLRRAALHEAHDEVRHAALSGLAAAAVAGIGSAVTSLAEVLSQKDTSTREGRLDWYHAEQALAMAAEPEEEDPEIDLDLMRVGHFGLRPIHRQ